MFLFRVPDEGQMRVQGKGTGNLLPWDWCYRYFV